MSGYHFFLEELRIYFCLILFCIFLVVFGDDILFKSDAVEGRFGSVDLTQPSSSEIVCS